MLLRHLVTSVAPAKTARVHSPLLRMDLFKSRAFALAAAVTVVGMFSFLGTAYAISIWMEVIQHQSAIRTAVAFILLSGLAIFLLPLTSFLMARLQPRWVLTLGFLLMGVGQLLASTMSVTDTALPSLILPDGPGRRRLRVRRLVGDRDGGEHRAGEASRAWPRPCRHGARPRGRPGPAVIGAIALSKAAGLFNTAVNGSLAPARLGRVAPARTGSATGCEVDPVGRLAPADEDHGHHFRREQAVCDHPGRR